MFLKDSQSEALLPDVVNYYTSDINLGQGQRLNSKP